MTVTWNPSVLAPSTVPILSPIGLRRPSLRRQAGIETLRGMRLDDLRALFLRKDGVYLCGSATIAGATRRTAYYSLDFAFMREFLGGVA